MDINCPPSNDDKPDPTKSAAKTNTVNFDGNLGDTPDDVPGTPKHKDHHLHFRGHRPHLWHPTGKKIHIASSPAHAEHLKRKHSALPDNNEYQIEYVVHGSQEHIDALRDIYAHHQNIRQALRERHGEELFNELEAVVQELDALNKDLGAVTEHAVQLDANFSKYGYDAHIRTHDSSPSGSSSNSLYGDKRRGSDQQDWDARKHEGQHMKFYVKPVIRQYFHKGLLWRAHELEEVQPYELFFDLFYVGILAVTGDNASEEANGHALLRFVITFILTYKVWADVTVIVSWFDANDIVRRLFVLFMMACLLGMTTNVVEFYGEAYTPLIAFYVTARLSTTLYYLWNAWLLPMVRASLILNALIILVPVAIWIASIHIEEYYKQIAIWLALLFDLSGVMWLILFQRGNLLPGKYKQWAMNKFDAFPATNIEHRIERTGAFITLVFGYSVVSLLYQNASEIGVNAFYGKAVLGMMQAFAFNWLYFEIDGFNIHTHAIRRHFVSSVVWLMTHLPLSLAYVLAGASLARVILVHDTPGTDYHDLSEFSIPKSEPELNSGLRWFYCAGLGIALICMNIISICSEYRTPPDGYRIGKPKRLIFRTVIGVIITFLGFAESLDSLELIGTTTSLVCLALAVELYGHSQVNECWNQRERRCRYSAKCHISKKDLEESARTGKVINLEELKGEKGFHDVTS